MSRARTAATVAVRAVPTPWGWAALEASELGIVRCSWPWPEAFRAKASGGEESRFPLPEAERMLEQAAAALLAFFAGFPGDMAKVTLDGRILTGWQRIVYEIVKKIPFGEVRSYGWVARECGRPGAARAVGRALAGNPFPLFVPCHRVVYGDGGVGNYSCEGTALPGGELKRRLLEWERRRTQESCGSGTGDCSCWSS